MATIEIEGLHKSFDGQQVLAGVDLRVEAGTTCALLGTSGSGKTVLLKHIIGLLRPDRGTVRVEGEDVASLSPVGLERLRRRIGILFQGDALFDSLSVFENVAFPLREHLHLRPGDVREKVRRTLALVDLAGVEEQYPGELSGGMRKRVAFARAIVEGPRILLCDDPTAGLDPLTTNDVAEALLSAKRTLGATSLIITSDLATAFQVADHLALLHEGRIVEHGPAEEFRRSKHPAVVAFLHDWLEQVAARHLPVSPV